MQVFYPFSFRRVFLCLPVGVLLTVVLLAEVLGTGVAHAAGGKAYFDMEPTFHPAYNARPRGNFIFNGNPAALIQDSIHIKNVGTARGTVNLYPVDATTSQMSGETFHAHTNPRNDVGAWIKLSSQQVTLDPGQSLDIPFNLSIPGHVRPGQHYGGIVAEEPLQKAPPSKSGSIQTAIQIQTLEILGVLVNIPGATIEKLNATGITYDQKSTYQRLLVELENIGTQALHPSGRLQVIDEAGRMRQNIPLQLDAILPQTSINYPVYIHHKALIPGTYTAILSLNYEDHHVLNYKTTFEVSLPQSLGNIAIAPAISDLVTLNPTNFFSALAPWQYVVGLAVIFAILSALLYGGRNLYRSTVNLRRKSNGRKLINPGRKK